MNRFHVAEEAAPAGVMRHVADRVDDDQRPDPVISSTKQIDSGVDQQRHIDLEAAHRDVGVQMLVLLPVGVPEQGKEAITP